MPDHTFLKLLGDLDVVTKQLGDAKIAPREFISWERLPEVGSEPVHDEFLVPPEPGEQPDPLALQLLCQPAVPGVYDVEWLAPEGAELAAGDTFARLFRVSDGLRDDQLAPFASVVRQHRVKRNAKVIAGSPLMDCVVPGVALPDNLFESKLQGAFMDFALAVNAVVKGFMGVVGQSGNITKSVIPVECTLDCYSGVDALIGEIVKVLGEHDLRDGDIVVLAEKPFAIAQHRLFPLELLERFDPKLCDRAGREELLRLVREHVPDADMGDLICADVLADFQPRPMATAGVHDPNMLSTRLANELFRELGRRCDVVISDTDTGLDVRETLIGTITLGATPLGATAGLVLYECMRVANAAEFSRGADRNIPVVICRPHDRRIRRDGLGQFRGYHGRLDAAREALLAYA